MSQIFVNNAKSTTAEVIGSTYQEILVVDSTSFPAITSPDYMIVSIEAAGQIELIKIIGKTGSTLLVDPIGRGWEGTTPLTFPIGARVEGRITAESIYTIISNANSDVTTEAAARLAADTTLQANISIEASTRATNDTNEANARIAADNTLQTNINTEASTRASADTTLQTNINTEASTRASADNTLQTNINTEASTRASADTALQTNIDSLGGGMIGSVAFFATNTAPTGWVKANGAVVSISGIYAALFAKIGYTFGSSGGTFALPNLRGVFIRGLDEGMGLDPGRTLSNTIQGDTFASHTHNYEKQYATNNTYGSGAATVWDGGNNLGATTSTGGTETRPKNIALLACIKY